MPLTDAKAAAMREATQEAAIALVDDLAFIGEVVNKAVPSRADIRRISGTLRRLLLEDHLTQVAAPRVGAIRFPVFDNGNVFEEIHAQFVTVGFAPIYGMNNGLFETFHADANNEGFLKLAPDERPIRYVRRDGFLADRVARLDGLYVSRADMLKFICHHDFGVHFNGNDAPVFNAIRRLRNAITFSIQNDGALRIARQDIDTVRPAGALMDISHAQTFSTAFFLVRAPDIRNLVAFLQKEISDRETIA